MVFDASGCEAKQPTATPAPSIIVNPFETFVADCSEEQQAIRLDVTHIEDGGDSTGS